MSNNTMHRNAVMVLNDVAVTFADGETVDSEQVVLMDGGWASVRAYDDTTYVPRERIQEIYNAGNGVSPMEDTRES